MTKLEDIADPFKLIDAAISGGRDASSVLGPKVKKKNKGGRPRKHREVPPPSKAADVAIASAKVEGMRAIKKLIHDDPVAFCRYVFIEMGWDKVAPISEVEEDMIRFIYGVSVTEDRRVAMSSRGLGKTTLGPVLGSLYRLNRDPDRKIIDIGQSQKMCRNTVDVTLKIIETVPALNHLKPRMGQRKSRTEFDVGPSKPDKQPSFRAIGIGGSLEGNRAHTIWADDVETKKNTYSPETRAELERMCGEFGNILYPQRSRESGGPIDPCEIVYCMTPKHNESLAVKLPKRTDSMGVSTYVVRSWPIAYPKPTEEVHYLAPMLAARLSNLLAMPGMPTCPLRFDEKEIDRRRAEGAEEFARESMLIANLNSSTAHPLRLRDLIVMDVGRDQGPYTLEYGTELGQQSLAINDIENLGYPGDMLFKPAMISPSFAPWIGTKAAIDPAGRGVDKLGLSIGAALAGRIFVKGVWGLDGGFDEPTIHRLCELLRLHDAREIYIEHNLGAGMFATILKGYLPRYFVRPGAASNVGWSCTIIDDTKITFAHGQKDDRICSDIEPILSTHRLVMDKRALMMLAGERTEDSLQYQMSRITRKPKSLNEYGKIDSLSLLCRAWKRSMNADPIATATRIQSKRDMENQIARYLGLDDYRKLGMPQLERPNFFR